MALNCCSQLPCLTLKVKGTVWRTSRQVCLLCRWEMHLAGFPHLRVVDRWRATPKRVYYSALTALTSSKSPAPLAVSLCLVFCLLKHFHYFQEFLKTVRINAEIKQVEWGDIPTHELSPPSEPSVQTSSGGYDNLASTPDNLHSSQPINSLVHDKQAYLKVSKINALHVVTRITKTKLHYTRGITPKRETSGGHHLRDLAAGQHGSEETSRWWRHCSIWPALEAFLCNVSNTSRTLLFSDKAWVYESHYLRDYCDFSVAR